MSLANNGFSSVNVGDPASLNILVTGAGGYIGSHACLALLEAGFNVIALDNMVNCWKDEHLPQPESLIRVQILAGRRLKFFHCDILCKQSLEQTFKEIVEEFSKIDVCMHFAALKAVGESCAKPLLYYKNNINGTINLIELLQKYGCKKLVYSSSATVYGDPKNLPISENELTGVGLTNPYGKTKFMTEEILKDLCNAVKDWAVISLRYFNPVGAHASGLIGEDPNGIPNNLVPFVAQVAAGKLEKLKVYGDDYPTKDGTGVRDYIHIIDLINGHLKVLEPILKDLKGFKAYNLGTGKGYSVLEVIRAFKEASGRDIPYEIVGRRPGDIAASYCDANLAEKELGWVATRDINEMCRDVWRWQSRNINGFKKETDPNCLLHSPHKLDILLANVTQAELQKADRKLHQDAIDKMDKIKMLEDYEKLKRLREVLKAIELLRLSKEPCKRYYNPTAELPRPEEKQMLVTSQFKERIESGLEELKKVRAMVKNGSGPIATQQLNCDTTNTAPGEVHTQDLDLPFCVCGR